MKRILSGFMAAALFICSASSIFAANDTRQYSSRGSITIQSDNSAAKKQTQFTGSTDLDFTSLLSWTSVSANIPTENVFTVTSVTGRVETGTTHPYIPVELILQVKIPANDTASKQSTYRVGRTVSQTSTAEAVVPKISSEPEKYAAIGTEMPLFIAAESANVNTSTVSAVAASADNTQCSPFEYYTMMVLDGSKVIFSAEDIPADTTQLEIPLGVLNNNGSDMDSSNYSNNNTYSVVLQENSKIDKSDVTNYALPTKWTWSLYAEQQPETVGAVATALPTASAAASIPTSTPKSISSSLETAAPSKTAVPDSVLKQTDYNLKAGEYVVGEDIAPGRYYVVGSGMLETYDEDGNMNGNIDLKAASDSLGYYLMTMVDGETINVSDDTDLYVSVPTGVSNHTTAPSATMRTRSTVTPRPTSTPRPTLTPKPTATPRPTSTPKATATPKPTSTPKVTSTPKATTVPKSNPKTGDTAPIAVLSLIGAAAICAIVAIQLKKKKEINK